MTYEEYRERIRFRQLFKAIKLQAFHQECWQDEDEFYPDNVETRMETVAQDSYSEGYQRGFHHGVAQTNWKHEHEGRDGAKAFERWSWEQLPFELKASVEFESWGPPKS